MTLRTRPSNAAHIGVYLGAALVLAVNLALTAVAASAAPGSYVVNSTLDQDSTTYRANCSAGTGICTLRAALTQADSDGIASTVNFNISGAGPHTINIASTLDTMNEGETTINGYSQQGASANTDGQASNAKIQVQIQGPGVVNGGVRGLVILSPRNTIRGLAIYNMWQDVHIGSDDATGNVIAGNFIGTNAAATFGAGGINNSTFGIVLRSGSDNNVIGGPSPADRNVISGLAGRGVLIGIPGTSALDTGTDANVVQNNILGLTPDGLARRPNFGHAIDLNNGVQSNRVVGNVVSGNSAEGIEISHAQSTRGNEVVGNKVGTNLAGTAGPAYTRNGSNGIQVEDGADLTVVTDNVVGNNGDNGIQIGSLSNSATGTKVQRNRIGISLSGAPIGNVNAGIRIGPGVGASPNQAAGLDTVIGTDNIIAFNGSGIRLEGQLSLRNTITRNSIFENAGLGIDILPTGVNQNDAGDGDSGPNTLLNWPELQSATTNSVSGRACAGCVVEVFLADKDATLDPSQQTSYGEGQTYVATATADGNGAFTATLPSTAEGRIVTATATDGTGNTSEFSRNLAVPSSK